VSSANMQSLVSIYSPSFPPGNLVEWGWVDHVLSKFNFGKQFREWVQMLFKYAQTCIKTNGFASKYFNISRSCRQAFPIIPSSSSRSVYYITSCIRRLASLILRPLTNPFWSECINFGNTTFNLSARIFAIIL
jgi:hypothetical protein